MLSKRSCCLVFLSTVACQNQNGNSATESSGSIVSKGKKIVLIYKGPGAFDEIDGNAGSNELADNLIRVKDSSTANTEVVFASPHGMAERLSVKNRGNVALVAFPGGPSESDMKAALVKTGAFDAIKSYVENGGRYFGICAGAYLAGSFVTDKLGYPTTERGLDFIPHRINLGSDQQTVLAHEMGFPDDKSPPKLLTIKWLTSPHIGDTKMYFQNGPSFYPDESRSKIYGRYSEVTKDANGKIYNEGDLNPAAAIMFPYHQGKVALIGPHPEASKDWFEDKPRGIKIKIPPDYTDRFNLGTRMIADLLQSP